MNVFRLAASTALVFAIAGGCASDKLTDAPSKEPRGVRNRMPTDEVARSERPKGLEPWNPFGDETQAKPAEQAAKAEEEDRDYSAELLAAIGSPASCLKPRVGKDAPSEIAVSLEVYVVETGLVTRGYARSSQLDNAEIECVQARLGSLRLRAPIKGAPRTVTASLELKQQPAGKKAGSDEAKEGGDDGEKEEKEKEEKEEKEVAEREPEPEKEPEEPRDEPQRDEGQRDPPPGDDLPREDVPREEAPSDDRPGQGSGDGNEAEPQPPE